MTASRTGTSCFLSYLNFDSLETAFLAGWLTNRATGSVQVVELMRFWTSS